MVRVIGPKHTLWTPRAYQSAGIEHLCANNSAALFYDPGLGKTSTTLAAFKTLKDHGIANRALVIAPVRVCQLVWEQEAAQWTQFKDLRFANMASKPVQTRKNQLLANADIWLINPESVAWLASQFQFEQLPFDTVIIDELTKFKNSRAKRSKLLQPLMDRVPRRWGLTGTPAPNGYEDLFGQMKILDSGAALGQYISKYRDRYFTRGHDGFSYELRPGADRLIQEKLQPYVHALRAEDYLKLPPLIEHEIAVALPKDKMEQYRLFKKQMVLDLADGSITAVNAAALSNKLTQFTSGAVYTGDGAWSHIHDAKIEALEELIDELSGQQLLVAYHYNHELERLLQRFPEARYIGQGVTERQVKEIEEDWNAGRLKLLFGHPASMGHGLNMQKSGASHICWFTQTWDYELYDQFIKRVLRQGTTATRITNHRLVAVDTIDKAIGDAVSMKRDEQDGLLEALKSEFIKDDPASARVFSTGENDVRRITLPGGEAPTTVQSAPAPQQAPAAPTGWGNPPAAQNAPAAPQAAAAPTGWGQVAQSGEKSQREAQAAMVAGPQTQPLAQAAQQGGWGVSTFPAQGQADAQPAAPQAPTGWGNPPATNSVATAPQEPEINVDPELAAAGSFAELARIQSQVLQPGALDPRFQTTTQQAISTGEPRIDQAQVDAQNAPFDGGQPAKPAPEKPERQKRVRKSAENKAATTASAAPSAPRVSFEIGSYIAQRIAQGADFVTAQNEAAQIVEAMEG